MGLRLWSCSLSYFRTWRRRRADKHVDDEQTTAHSDSSTVDGTTPMLQTKVSFDASQWLKDTEALLAESCPDSAVSETSASSTLVHSAPLSRPGLVVPPPEQMSVETVRRVVRDLGRLFGACDYAVHGLGAMAYYGFDGRLTDRVNIYCPRSAMAEVRDWAEENNVLSNEQIPTAFGIRTANDSLTRLIRIIYITELPKLRTVRVGPSLTAILSIPEIANLAARAYIDCPPRMAKRQAVHAADVHWLARKSVEMSTEEHRWCAERVPFVLDERFWGPFVVRFGDAVALCRRAGLEFEGSMVRRPLMVEV